MTESNDSGSFLHPLFDPTSNYRAASRRSVWGTDGGKGSIKRFFVDHLRALYLQEPLSEEPRKVPSGLFPKGVYELHWRQRKAVARPAVTVPAALAPGNAGVHPEAGAPPGVLRFDLNDFDRIAPFSTVDRFNDLFAGDNHTLGPTWTANYFSVRITRMPPRRQCLVLVADYELQLEIAKVLRHKAWKREEEAPAIAAIKDALVRMQAAPDNVPEREVAFHLAMLFSLAPGLEGSTDEDGIFRIEEFPLAHDQCRRMPDNHLLVCCAGPSLPGSGVN